MSKAMLIKRRRAALAVAGTIVMALAVALYVTVVPGQVGGRFEDRAQALHTTVQSAMEVVHRTFERRTFEVSIGGIAGANEARLAASASPTRLIVAVQRDEDAEARRLARVRSTIRSARATLDAAKGEMADVEAPLLLGDTGAIRAAEAVAADESAYLREARAFLDEYDAVVLYALASLEQYSRSVTLEAREYEAFAEWDVSGDVRRLASRLAVIADHHERASDSFAGRHLPAAATALHQAQLQAYRDHARAVREFVSALAARDGDAVRRVFDEESAALERAGRRQGRLFDDFLWRSTLRSAITDLAPLNGETAV